MNNLLSNIKIQVNDKIYVKDPETSALGKKIIEQSIYLINEIGFEDFTFKKLGERIDSNESSIYRYFENKHKLLVYLSSWYWSWMEYKLVFATSNITDIWEKLNKAILLLTERSADDQKNTHIDKSVLYKIILLEYAKTTHTKEVDKENKEGYFTIYKRLISRVVNMVHEANPDYPYAKSLISSIVEGALHQHFLAQHMKSITNCNENTDCSEFYLNLINNILKRNT